jgi:thiol:disulfide interchange protein
MSACNTGTLILHASGKEPVVGKHSVATVVIVVALCSFGVLVFAQLNNITKQRPPLLTRGEADRRPPADPAPALKTAEEAKYGINWQYDLHEALELAKTGDKFVVVDVYTDWCGWCKKMDQVIYTDPLVVNLNYSYIFLKLDAEDNGQGEGFARRMDVKGYPTTIVLDKSGRRLAQKAGYMQSAQRFVQFVGNARLQRDTDS